MSTVEDNVLDGLRAFQRATVEHVWTQMERPEGTQRMLVADEVGLGKTRIAAALIRQIESQRPRRATVVVYFGPNAEVVRQNMRVLRKDDQPDGALERLTLLPLSGGRLKERRLHVLGFTQGTSLSPVKRGTGRATERALLLAMVERPWGIRVTDGTIDVFRMAMGVKNFRSFVDDTVESEIDAKMATAFTRELKKRGHLRDEFLELRRSRSDDKAWRQRQRAFVGALRLLLARTVLDSLKPEIVIFDEFQKYPDLLIEAQRPDTLESSITQGRVLLLSATPYRMRADDFDPGTSVELLTLLQFLLNENGAARDALAELDEMRRGFRKLKPKDHPGFKESSDRVAASKRMVEARLRPIMSRSQRPRLSTPTKAVPLFAKADDLLAYLAFQRAVDVAARDAPKTPRSTIEYWKSAPYLVAFMRGYRVKELIDAAWDEPAQRRPMVAELRKADGATLPMRSIERFERVPRSNARLRYLTDHALDADQWRTLWVPPSLPPYALEGPFARASDHAATKTLVFSGWRVVPAAVAALVGYEAERRAAGSALRNSAKARRTRVSAQLLTPRYDKKRGAQRSSAVALAYPSTTLADAVNPYTPRDSGKLASPRSVLREARHALAARIDGLRRYEADERRRDVDWYWLAPLLLDHDAGVDVLAMLRGRDGLRGAWRTADGDKSTSLAVPELLKLGVAVIQGHRQLGPQPGDLPEVLAQLAVAGPGVTAYRSLRGRASDDAVRIAAARMGWGLRGLLGRSDAVLAVRSALPRGKSKNAEGYWRQALSYCVMGGLQGVVDEYVHLLLGEHGDRRSGGQDDVEQIATGFVRTTDLSPLAIAADGRGSRGASSTGDASQRRLTSRFAVAFGASRTENDASVHPETVRQAFNSPFWPWVLVTTSVGQEGLDFHRYCHNLIHWNIPASPVELEQREGRVLRFLGHAVRKNIAETHDATGRGTIGPDRWFEMVTEAARVSEDPAGFAPEWHYTRADGATVTRTAPVFAYSRDQERLKRIQSARIYYRLVLGQPDPAELVEVLMETIPEEEAEQHVASLALDLAPQPAL